MKVIPAGSILLNVSVTLAVALFVVLMPWLDQKVCARLGVSPWRGSGDDQQAARVLRMREVALCVILLAYLAIFAYIVFFSRSASEDYRVHIALFENLARSVNIDFGVFEFLVTLVTQGPASAFSHVNIEAPRYIGEVYLNIMLFVPIGYLLPYVFRWFRARVRIRPVVACFIISLLTENIQLIFKLGFYDIDDLITNTIGGFFGQMLFVAFAYVVTNPDWRRELRSLRRWRKKAKQRTLYPFARNMKLARTKLMGTSEEAVWDFYVEKLGFRLVGQHVPLDSPGTVVLYQLGQFQVEICCANADVEFAEQYLNISVRNLAKVRERLLADGIEAGPIEDDYFRGIRRFTVDGPDNVRITFLESYVG